MHVYDPSVFLHAPKPHGDLAHSSISVKKYEQIHIYHLKRNKTIMNDELSITYFDITHLKYSAMNFFSISQDDQSHIMPPTNMGISYHHHIDAPP